MTDSFNRLVIGCRAVVSVVLIHNDGCSNLCNVSKRLFILNQHLGELETLFWTDPHHVPQQEDPVWSVAHLQGQHNFNNKRSELEPCETQRCQDDRDKLGITDKSSITNLLGVEDNLLELSCLCKALNDLVGDVGSEVDTEGKSRVYRLHQVSKLLRALQL